MDHIHKPKMEFGVFQQPLIALLEDTVEVESLLKDMDSQCARRMYIRSLFSLYEGTIWLIKQTCLNASCEVCRKVRHPDKEGLLKDENYEVDANGDIKTRPRFTPLASNLRFAFMTFSDLFGVDIDLETGSHHWKNFKDSIGVRNRITHPRSAEDLLISDEEFAKCQDSSYWFNRILHEVLAALTGDRIEGA